MKKLLILTSLIFPINARADCGLYQGADCYQDDRGNTIATQQNTNGTYSTYKNGYQNSTTSQEINGSWKKEDNNGSVLERYSQDPYHVDKYK